MAMLAKQRKQTKFKILDTSEALMLATLDLVNDNAIFSKAMKNFIGFEMENLAKEFYHSIRKANKAYVDYTTKKQSFIEEMYIKRRTYQDECESCIMDLASDFRILKARRPALDNSDKVGKRVNQKVENYEFLICENFNLLSKWIDSTRSIFEKHSKNFINRDVRLNVITKESSSDKLLSKTHNVEFPIMNTITRRPEDDPNFVPPEDAIEIDERLLDKTALRHGELKYANEFLAQPGPHLKPIITELDKSEEHSIDLITKEIKLSS